MKLYRNVAALKKGGLSVARRTVRAWNGNQQPSLTEPNTQQILHPFRKYIKKERNQSVFFDQFLP
jgi:hypothetical protein